LGSPACGLGYPFPLRRFSQNRMGRNMGGVNARGSRAADFSEKLVKRGGVGSGVANFFGKVIARETAFDLSPASPAPRSTKIIRRDTATARSPITLSAPARRVAMRKPRKDELDTGAIKTLLGA